MAEGARLLSGYGGSTSIEGSNPSFSVTDMRPPMTPRSRTLAVAAVLTLTASTPAAASPRFTIVGRGFGHGVGLSQYGAQGLALQGRTTEQILQHYYRGTTIGPAASAPVRVLLGIRSNPCFQLADGYSATVEGAAASQARILRSGHGRPPRTVPPGGRPITDSPTAWQLAGRLTPPSAVGSGHRRPAPTWSGSGRFAADGSTVTGAFCATTNGSSVELTRDGRTLASGARVTIAPSEPFGFESSRYRGALVLRATTPGVEIVDHLDVDSYVRGGVARAAPSSGRPAALEAQAVVARSYALAEASPTGSFDVYPDERSQVYGGVSAETAPTDRAVAATARQVVLTAAGTVATTFFSSSSGGRTAANEDVWVGPPVPYLRSVPDPSDRISPYSAWGPLAYSAAQLGARLGVGRVAAVSVRTNPSRRVSSLTVRSRSGSETTFSGTSARTALGLRSTWFRISMLDLSAVVRRGGGLTIVGRSSSARLVALLAEGADGRTRPIRTVRPSVGGLLRLSRVRVPAGRRLELRTGRTRSYVVVAP